MQDVSQCDFFDAIRQHDVETIRCLIATDRGILHSTDEEGRTAFHLAAAHNNHDLVELLLSEEPSLAEIKDEAGQTGLNMAERRGYNDLVKLIRRNIQANRFFQAIDKGERVVVQELLNNNPGLLDMTDQFGCTALHAAAMNNDEQMLSLLLDRNPLLAHTQDIVGFTPLHTAAWAGAVNAVNLLVNRCKPAITTIQDNYNETALDIARRKGIPPIISLLQQSSSERILPNQDARRQPGSRSWITAIQRWRNSSSTGPGRT